jgi:two-component system KDP operon response regulator KdpE
MNNGEILIIDDEPQIRKLLDISLRSNGYSVSTAATAKEGIDTTVQLLPDLVILDLGLPDESGHTTLAKLREWYTKPVIILSVKNSEQDIIMALDNGANDYLVKPFRTGELMARIRSVLRNQTINSDEPVIKYKIFEIDFVSRIIKKENEIVKLTATQYNLLALFSKNENRVLTHQYILREIWGNEYENELQYLRVYIGQLRKKIEKDANHPKHLITESGIGYRFSGEG